MLLSMLVSPSTGSSPGRGTRMGCSAIKIKIAARRGSRGEDSFAGGSDDAAATLQPVVDLDEPTGNNLLSPSFRLNG